jgi:RNA polymerase sigma factor (sigma-70 family)
VNRQRRLALQSGPTPNGTRLDPHLLHVALVVWSKTRKLAKLVYKSYGERVNERELKHFARVAAYLAYIDCGGQSGRKFAWAEQRERLLKRAHHHMLQLLRRQDRTYEHDQMMNSARTEVVAVDQYRWDAWDQPLRTKNRGRLHNHYLPVADVQDTLLFDRREYLPPPDQELQLVEQVLQDLGNELANSLSDKDFALLNAHYWQQTSQRQLASDLGMTENALNVRLHRARARARKALERRGNKWREIAMQV